MAIEQKNLVSTVLEGKFPRLNGISDNTIIQNFENAENQEDVVLSINKACDLKDSTKKALIIGICAEISNVCFVYRDLEGKTITSIKDFISSLSPTGEMFAYFGVIVAILAIRALYQLGNYNRYIGCGEDYLASNDPQALADLYRSRRTK